MELHGNDKPVIVRDEATVALSSASQTEGLAVTISGTVVDRDADLPEQNLQLTLYYRHVGETGYTEITHLDDDCGNINNCLVDQGGGNYAFNFTIPSSTVLNPGVEYYLMASDALLTTYGPVEFHQNPYMTSSVG